MIEKICGIEVDVVRKQVKNIRIKVGSDGSVLLVIPNRCAKKAGVDFFLEKIDWVKEKVKYRADKPPFAFRSGEKFYLFGEQTLLKVEIGRKNGYLLNSGCLFLTVRDLAVEKVKSAFEKALKEILLNKAQVYFEKWVNLTGLKHSSLTVKKTISKWGSCNCATNQIGLSLYLANLPEFCLDYVVLHELCHIKYANHGVAFKNLLSVYMPAWTLVKKYMKDNSQNFTLNF